MSKDSIRVSAYGTVDEANAAVGMARVISAANRRGVDAMLARIQNDLFDLGADLCVPDAGNHSGTNLCASPQLRLAA